MRTDFYSKTQFRILNTSYVTGDLYNLDNTFFEVQMCCLGSLDDL